MRFVVCAVASLWLALAVGLCHAAPAPFPGTSTLTVAVHAPGSVTLYSPRYEGGTWESHFGERLKTGLENQLGSAFAKVVPLASYPPSPDAPPADEYVVLVQGIARFYGRGTLNAEAHAAISVYNARREHVKDLEASTEFKVVLPAARDAQEARFDAAVGEVIQQLASKLVSGMTDAELQMRLERTAAEARAEREHPVAAAPPKAAPTVFGRLVLTTTPAGATVFLDDVYWGQTNADGKLTIGGVGAGPHVVRLKMSGYKELKQTIEISPGDNPVSLKQQEAEPKPLSEPEIEDALRHDVPRPRVNALIRQYGVTFTLTKESEIRLRDAGADNEMLTVIAQSKK